MAILELILYGCIIGGSILAIVLGIIFGTIMLVLMMIRAIKEWRVDHGK